jgi:RNA recognition motif-containing protein
MQASISLAEQTVLNIHLNDNTIVLIGLKAINGLTIDGSKVSVRPSCSTDLNPNTTIFIRNLTQQATISELLPLLSQFGTVLSAYMPIDPILKKPKGIAYIDYDTPEAAKGAIEQVS